MRTLTILVRTVCLFLSLFFLFIYLYRETCIDTLERSEIRSAREIATHSPLMNVTDLTRATRRFLTCLLKFVERQIR